MMVARDTPQQRNDRRVTVSELEALMSPAQSHNRDFECNCTENFQAAFLCFTNPTDRLHANKGGE